MKYLSIALFAVLLGGLSGCASVKMQDVSLIGPPNDKKVIVNFVRPAIFLGDGIDVDIWDGGTYVGSLGAGKLIQREVEPGKHIFIADAENCTYVSGDLVAGKQYFLKANIFPGAFRARVALGVVKSDDERVAEWLRNLKPTAITEKDRKEKEEEKKAEIQKAIAEFESDGVSFSEIQPEDAR